MGVSEQLETNLSPEMISADENEDVHQMNSNKRIAKKDKVERDEVDHKTQCIILRYLYELTQQPGWDVNDPIPAAITNRVKLGDLSVTAVICGTDALRFDRVPVIEWLADQMRKCNKIVIQVCKDVRYLAPFIDKYAQCGFAMRYRDVGMWKRISDTASSSHIRIDEVARNHPVCLSRRIEHQLLEFHRVHISVGKVVVLAIKDIIGEPHSVMDHRMAAMFSAMDRVLAANDEQVEWLTTHELPIGDLTNSTKTREYQIVHRAMVEFDRYRELDVLAMHRYGSEYATSPEIIQSILADAIDLDGQLIIGMLLLKVVARSDLGSSIELISPSLANRCLESMMKRCRNMGAILAAVRCGADPSPFLHKILKTAMWRDDEMALYHGSNIPVCYEKINDIFWSLMAKGWPYHSECSMRIWKHYSDYIRPAGILKMVDSLLNTPLSASDWSCWRLAYEIDPEARCYVANQMDVGQRLCDLIKIGQVRLDMFLSRFSMKAPSLHQTNPTLPNDTDGHRLDVFAKGNLAMRHAIISEKLIKEGCTMAVIQSLIDASEKNAIAGDYASYHLHADTLLIVDSPVEKRGEQEDICELVTSEQYYNLQVVGIDLKERHYLDSKSVMLACQACVSLTQLAWRKQQDLHAAEIATMRAEIAKLTVARD